MRDVQLSVLIVTYNSGDFIVDCLDAVTRAGRSIDLEVLVHDNGSTDTTVDRLQRRTDCSVDAGRENLGFARACNVLAAASSGRHLLFLNPDTVVHPDAFRELLAAAERHPDAGITGARTVSPDGHVQRTCAQGQMSMWSLFCFATGLSTLAAGNRWLDPESLGGWARDSDRVVPFISGGAMLVTRTAFDRLGGFDEQFFMYAEDADLCVRAWRAGYRPRLAPHALVTHAVGQSSSPGQKQVLLHRGKVSLIHKHYPGWQGRLAMRLLLSGVALRAAAARRGAFPERAGRSTGAAWLEAWSRRHEWRHGWPQRTRAEPTG